MINEGVISPLKNLDVDSLEELLVDLEVVKGKMHARLDQFIKVKIQKHGIRIIHNTYTGLDTEYVHVRDFKNRLIYVQTAVKKRTIIKIPSV